MTTVLGCATPGHAWIAGDSGTNVYDRPVLTAVKVRRLTTTDGHEFLLGFAGDGGGPAALAGLTVETFPDLDDEADRNGWAEALASAITDLYVGRGLHDGGRLSSHLLLAVPGYLWTVLHHQAIPHHDGLSAIGSGEGPALGAMHALLASGMGPAPAIRAACAIGIDLDRYSDGPITVESL